ncbi:hypothetical protein BC835DRAFT_1336612 [Cytidiella melzeri]|nr:hypothetical protein BC835DRAFT_1336612 [Cytidiella melzeri]
MYLGSSFTQVFSAALPSCFLFLFCSASYLRGTPPWNETHLESCKKPVFHLPPAMEHRLAFECASHTDSHGAVFRRS